MNVLGPVMMPKKYRSSNHYNYTMVLIKDFTSTKNKPQKNLTHNINLLNPNNKKWKKPKELLLVKSWLVLSSERLPFSFVTNACLAQWLAQGSNSEHATFLLPFFLHSVPESGRPFFFTVSQRVVRPFCPFFFTVSQRVGRPN